MNAPPLTLGGWSPVVAYLRHSMIVFDNCQLYVMLEVSVTYRFSRAVVSYNES